MSQGYCPEVRIFAHNVCPGRRFCSLQVVPRGLSGGRGGLDEIDTCMSHRHVRSDMAGPTSFEQVIHASLKCLKFFQLQSGYGSKRL